MGGKFIPIQDRIAEGVGYTVVRETGCHQWIRGKTTSGYGCVYFDGRLRLAHRVAYEMAGNTIPDGHHIDHLCRNRACVNPAHLEAVTPRENMQRARRETCRAGHPMSGSNLFENDKRRRCRACHRASVKRSKARALEARAMSGEQTA